MICKITSVTMCPSVVIIFVKSASPRSFDLTGTVVVIFVGLLSEFIVELYLVELVDVLIELLKYLVLTMGANLGVRIIVLGDTTH